MSLITYNDFKAEPGLLGKRETRYFLGMAQGFSDKEIARDCGVSPNTVAGARKRILYKLNAVRMTHAVALAFAQGMVKHLCLMLMMATLVGAAASGADYQFIQRGRTRTAQTNPIRTREELHVAAA